MEKSRFCVKYLDENGVPSDRRPVWYDEGTGEGRVTRVLINASWFPSWKMWHDQAEKALTAALVEHDHFKGTYVMRGDSYPIVGDPHYLLEPDGVWQSGYTIWINALCPTEDEFYRAVAEAKERIANKGKPVAGQRIASLNAPLPLLPVCSRNFQQAPGTIGASFAH